MHALYSLEIGDQVLGDHFVTKIIESWWWLSILLSRKLVANLAIHFQYAECSLHLIAIWL